MYNHIDLVFDIVIFFNGKREREKERERVLGGITFTIYFFCDNLVRKITYA